jgi:hypothetical protein
LITRFDILDEIYRERKILSLLEKSVKDLREELSDLKSKARKKCT